jgi:hypothetical protein
MVQQARGLDLSYARKHLSALRASSRLTTIHREMYQPMAAEIKPERVIEVLHRAGVNPVLMGTHGLGGWRRQARATDDVDVLVAKKDVLKATRAIRQAFPDLIVQDTPVVTRFVDPATATSVIDLMKPTQRVYQLVFRHTLPVGKTHRIPNLEMALVSKFAAMVSPNRSPEKKMSDGSDFINIVRHNRADIDISKLKRLADKVYEDGAEEIEQMIEAIDAGRTLQL